MLGLALVLVSFGWFVYVRTSDNLLEEFDAGLRSRAEVLTADVRAHGPTLPVGESALLERDEAFAQITDVAGRVLESSAIVAGQTLVDAPVVAALHRPALFDAHVPRIDDVTRVIAVPVRSAGETYVVLVGGSLQDRRDQVLQLAATLAAAGLVTPVLAGLGAWWVGARRCGPWIACASGPIPSPRRTRAVACPSRPATTRSADWPKP